MQPFKRKRDADIMDFGDLINQLNVAVEYLKTRRQEHTASSILGYLSLQHAPKATKQQLVTELKGRSDVSFSPGATSEAGLFKYKPKIPVGNDDELKTYLASRQHSVGVRFEDIRDGWPDSQPAVDAMEQKHEVLLIRDKKNSIKLVWPNNPDIAKHVDAKVEQLWMASKLPANPDELRAKLQSVGLKPTSAPKPKVNQAAKKKSNKGQRKNTKTTNKHLDPNLLRDYSHKKGR